MTDTHQAHVTDAMIIEWDVPIEMDDGLQLRAQIFRPVEPGSHRSESGVEGLEAFMYSKYIHES